MKLETFFNVENLLNKKIESILERVEKPARYIGGEVGSVVKEEYSSRLVLSYPDVYELGIANQAIQIIYAIVNHQTNAWAERAYCPWTDAAALMRAEGLPLFSLESWRAVRTADLWGITLQFELTYTNILEMLDLAGVPLQRADRGEGDPLVFGGGPAAANPHPMEPFFDFFIVGDGEEVVPRVLGVYEAGRGMSRAGRIAAIGQVEGVYVPGSGNTVKRAVVSNLAYDMIPLKPVVPSLGAVHDRAVLEITRGCTRGCRFCLAGVWYRPVRERPGADVCRGVADLVAGTGYEEVSLSSLSATDHSGIRKVLKDVAEAQPGLTVSLPSLRADADVFRLLTLIPSRKGSVTLAPEAGSQRLRDAINKQVTGADIKSALIEAFRLGCTTVKLYFMIGLPGETEADLLGIIDIAVMARGIGRQYAERPGRTQINVSIASFVPKPHTPFQWYGMNQRRELEEKQGFLRRNMPRKQIRLSLHDLAPSMVEGAVARGGAVTAGAIEAAWRSGARFDAWSELFNMEAWESGFAAIGASVEAEAARGFGPADPLPWDDIDAGVTKEFLLGEMRRAEQGQLTPDCREECHLCGVCEDGIQMVVGRPGSLSECEF